MMLLAFKFGYNLVCLFSHLLVDVLALLVVFVDERCLRECFLEVAFDEQVYGFCAVLHTS